MHVADFVCLFFLLARGKKEQSLHYEHNPRPENWTCYNDTNEFLNCWNDKVFGLQHKHLDVLERIFAVCGRIETREKSALNKYFIVCIFGLRSLSENARNEWGREKEKRREKKQETCTSNRVYAKSNRCNTPGAYSFLFNFSPICSFVPKFFSFQLVLFLFMLVVVVYIWPNIFWIVCSDSGTKVENVMFEMEEQQNSNIFEIELRLVSPFCFPFAKREICCFFCCNFRLCRCFSYLFIKLIAFCEFTWIFLNKLNSIKRNWWNRFLWPRKLSTIIMIQIET